MSSVVVTVDYSAVTRAAAVYRAGPKLVDVAVVRAMNRGGDQGLTQVRKDLVQNTGISAADTRRSKGLTKSLATTSRPSYRVRAASSYTPLSYFKPQATPEGVRANPWNRSVTFPGTFMLRMSSGYQGVFRRDTTAPRQTVTTRAGRTIKAQPIKELWGPSLAVEMMRGGIPEDFRRVSGQATMNRLPHELKHALDKAASKGSKRR